MVLPAMTSPAVETTHAPNKFYRCSFMRSEIRPQATMLIPPQIYGIMVIQPTSILLKLPSDLMICGMKKSIPKLAVTMPR